MADDPDILPLESVPSQSSPVSSMRVVNAYAEKQQDGARSAWARFASPGIVTVAELGDGPVRGLHLMAGQLYAVSDNHVWSLDEDGTATSLDSGIVGSGPVSIDDNGTQLMITNGDFGWTYDTASGIQQATSIFFYPAKTNTFFDGYFFFDRVGTNNFFRSDLLDGQSYPADNFVSAESRPDNVVAVRALGNILWVLGEATIEPWYDAGADDFPLRRQDGGIVRRGCSAAMSVMIEDSKLFFLGDDRVFYSLGGGLTRLSTHALEHLWQSYERVDDAFAFSCPWNGHKFINLIFPAANAAFAVDLANGKWHERESIDVQGRAMRWRANCAVAAYGKIWIGDFMSGKVGYLDASTFTEFDETFITSFVMPNLGNGVDRVRMPWFFLDVESGVSLNTGQGSDAQWMLDWSDDGGRTWVQAQQWRGVGAIGEYNRRLFWDRLGSFYQRTMRVSCSDPVKRVAIAARTPGLRVGGR